MKTVLILFYGAVGEKDEVSIKDVADAIVKALKFEGDYSVCIVMICLDSASMAN